MRDTKSAGEIPLDAEHEQVDADREADPRHQGDEHARQAVVLAREIAGERPGPDE